MNPLATADTGTGQASRGETTFPVSYSQQRLWLLHQMLPSRAVYNVGQTVRMLGRLDVAALERSLAEVVRRQESMRTCFALSGEAPVQIIAHELAVRLEVEVVEGATDTERTAQALRLAQAEAQTDFDLRTGPLWRARLLRLGSQEHWLQITLHHIVTDGWSSGILIRELSQLYAAYSNGVAPLLPALHVQYADFAVWQREWLQGEVLTRQLGYWKKALAEVPVLELPTDRTRPLVSTYRGGRVPIRLSQSLTQDLKVLSLREGATLFMTLLAAFQVLLSRYSRQTDVAVGVPTAGRTRPEVEGLIGFFVNTLVMRGDLSGAPTFKAYLARVREGALEAYAHQDLPFEKLVEELAPKRDLSRNPLFQVSLVLHNTPPGEWKLPGLTAERVEGVSTEAAKFDQSLSLRESAEGVGGNWEYAIDLFDASTIERMARHFLCLLESIVADPEQRVSELPMLRQAERHLLLVEWNGTAAEASRNRRLHELFEEHVERAPGAVALAFEQQRLTYGELNERANRLAHRLLDLGVGPEVLVGLFVERSPELIVGLLAILKAGGAYVPLDPSYPANRLAFMLDDAQPAIVLTQSNLLESLPPTRPRTICIDEEATSADGASVADASSNNPRSAGDGSNASYVIYTSGSTGQPKGVVVSHHNVCRLLDATSHWFGFGSADVWTLFHSFAFDFSVWEIWGALAFGGRLVIVPHATSRSPIEFLRLLRREGVTVLNQTPSAFRQLMVADENEPDSGPDSTLRAIIFGGEALDFRSLKPWAVRHGVDRPRLVNMYGITETTVHVTYRELSRADLDDPRSIIGRPIPDLRLYVLNESMQPVPIGVPGELHVGGAGLARGYLNHPELTAQKFLRDPFSSVPDARMYRTGDLARYLPDGNLEFLGRIDDQVKIRGFRIELGEIEAILAEHAAVRQVVVTVREDVPGDKRLVAYVVPSDPSLVGAEPLRTLSRNSLPEYMRPSAYVLLERLPLTPNGKVDRRALPAPDYGREQSDAAFVAPRSALENAVADVWREVLRLDRVGVHDNFFDLGGHSLLAAQVIARLRRILKLEVPLQHLFEAPTLAHFSAKVQSLGSAGSSSEVAPIEPALRTSDLPLSFAQQRLWFLDRLLPARNTYNIPAAWHLQGQLDVPALQRTLDQVLARHEMLRTRFILREGEPVQVIDSLQEYRLPLTDLSAMPQGAREARALELAHEHAHEPFDLESEPLLRAQLLRLAAREHILLLNVHHIAFDGWSLGVFNRELSVLYDAFRNNLESPLEALPIQYADYAVWQRKWLRGDVLESQLRYWKSQLNGLTTLKLPADRPRPAMQSYQGARTRRELPASLLNGLKTLARREGATLFMTLFAAFQVLLHRYSGQDDIAVGTPIAGRGRAELEGLIGFFANTLVLRTDLSGDPAFRALLSRVRERALAAYIHQDLPFEKLVEELAPARDLSRNPLFQVMFVLQNASDSLALDGIAVSPVSLQAVSAKFDLMLSVREMPDGLKCGWEYCTDLFDAHTIERMAGNFHELLRGIVANPDRRIGRMPLLTAAERQQLLSTWNDTAADDPRDRTLQRLFEEQAAGHPDAVAVVCAGQQLSYRELNTRANQLARHLLTIGVGPEVPVGVCLERSPELIVGLLGILKAGGAYVPLDPDYPRARLAFMLNDTQAPVLLTRESLSGQLPTEGRNVVCLDRDWAVIDACDPSDLPADQAAGNLGYIVYTSGSTGEPKGILLPQATLVNLIAWHGTDASTGRVAQFTSISFDVSVQEIFHALLSGKTLVVVDSDTRRQPEKLSIFIGENAITDLFVPNIVLEYLAQATVLAKRHLPTLANVYQAGEALTITPVVSAFFETHPVCRLHNHYGPAESHVVTASTLPANPRAWPYRPHVGSPISNTRIYVLSPYGEPVPIGVTGELYVGGAGLALGYLNRPELTEEKFLPDPFSDVPGARMYRTGDLARFLPDGNVEFLNRIDDQVKIRGHRIELGEIEAVLAKHAAVRRAVVTVREDIPGDSRLVAYVLPSDPSFAGSEQLRALSRDSLPEYMRPSAYVWLERLPLTPNGKVDRRALPAPEYGREESDDAFVAPRSALEKTVADVWREVLRLDRVGVHHNFFDLGGHSLLAAQVIARLSRILKIEVPLQDLFEAPTLAHFATEVQEALTSHGGSSEITPAEPALRTSGLPLSFAQQRMWFLDRLLPARDTYNIPAAWRLQGPLDVTALRHSLDRMVARHEMLRTRFIVKEGRPAQVIDPPQALALPVTDLSALPRAERDAHALELANADARRHIDLEAGPLLRAQLLRLAAQDHVLLVNVHHIASDGWSVGVFDRELSALYNAFRKDGEPALADLPIQYADYAVWQRAWLRGEVLESQLGFWTAELADLPTLELPTDRARPPMQSYRGSHASQVLSASLLQGLKELGRREGATLFMTMLAAFQVLLHRYTGQEDIAVGTPIAGRGRAEVEGLIGFFANTLVLRSDLSGNPGFRVLLARVRERALAAYTHQDLPFEKLVEELNPARDLRRNPLFQVMFGLQNASDSVLALDGIQVSRVPQQRLTAKFDLTLMVRETSTRLHCGWEYSTDLFDASTVERMARHFERLLEGIVANPELRIDELQLLSEDERHQLLVEWNDTTADYPADRSIHQLFEDQARRTPEAVAVLFDDAQLTYGQLDARANQLAHRLIELGVGHEVLVGVCLERSLDLVVGLLAILKAGGAYVPLDPSYPKERLAFMLQDSKAAVLVTQQALVEKLPHLDTRALCLDRDRASIAAQPAGLPSCAATAASLAYVVYTSGSTGRPKGVAVPHRAVLRLLLGIDYVQLDARQTLLLLSPISFDASTFELWGALLHGARCAIFRDRVPTFESLGRDLQRYRVSTLWLTASLFNVIVDQAPQILRGVRQLLTGGEALSPTHVRAALERLPDVQLINGYGPTESTTFTCCYRISSALDDSRASIPIGRPISNTRVYVLDRHGNPVPVGVTGELWIGGDGLARGYLHRPELTAEKFLPDPFAGEPGARMYRTGDRVRYLPDGNIEFAGRIDDQVKIRGFRVELGEIGAKLAEHPAVRQAVVVMREDTPGSKRLVAYTVPADASSATPEVLRAFLRQSLPDYMQPAAYVTLERLPLTPSGKIDRRSLPVPSPVSARSHDAQAAPRDTVERALCGLWAETLRIERVGVDDNFFEIGGDSLLAARLFDRLDRAFGRALPLATLFEAPTIRELARFYRTAEEPANRSALVPITPGGSLPPVFAVPGVGGNVLGFAEVARELGFQQPFFGLQSIGLDGTCEPLERVEEMAAQYLHAVRQQQPHGPYYLLGACFGSTVAYEMAHQLVNDGEEVAFLGLLDPSLLSNNTESRPVLPLPGWLKRGFALGRFVTQRFGQYREGMRALGLKERMQYMRDKAQLLKDAVEMGDLFRGDRREFLQQRVTDTNLRAMRRHRHKPLEGRVVAFDILASEHRFDAMSANARVAWNALSGTSVTYHRLPAKDSGDMLRGDNARTTATLLAVRLRDARRMTNGHG